MNTNFIKIIWKFTYNFFTKKDNEDIYVSYKGKKIEKDLIVVADGVGSSWKSTIFREKNQAKQVSAGLECGISFKDFSDFQKKDIIEAYNSTITERII